MNSAMRTALFLMLVLLLSGSAQDDCHHFSIPLNTEPPDTHDFHLGVTPQGGGSVSADGEPRRPDGQPSQCNEIDCTFQAFPEADFVLVATPAPGFGFVRWRNGDVDHECPIGDRLAPEVTVRMRATVRVFCVAEFAVAGDSVQLTVNVIQARTVTTHPALIDECASSCSGQFPLGQPVRLIPLASEGSHFVSWTGDCADHLDVGQEALLTPTAAVTCGANFASGPGLRPVMNARDEHGTIRNPDPLAPPAVLVHSSFWVVAQVPDPPVGLTYSYDWEPMSPEVCSLWVRDNTRSTFDADWRQCVIERDADFKVTVRASDGQTQVLKLHVKAQSDDSRLTVAVAGRGRVLDLPEGGAINCRVDAIP